MDWWDFLRDLVGVREFPNDYCGKCQVWLGDWNKTGAPSGIPYGTFRSNRTPILCTPCYARFLIMVAEWLPNPKTVNVAKDNSGKAPLSGGNKTDKRDDKMTTTDKSRDPNRPHTDK